MKNKKTLLIILQLLFLMCVFISCELLDTLTEETSDKPEKTEFGVSTGLGSFTDYINSNSNVSDVETTVNVYQVTDPYKYKVAVKISNYGTVTFSVKPNGTIEIPRLGLPSNAIYEYKGSLNVSINGCSGSVTEYIDGTKNQFWKWNCKK